jgi:hypothetical protein
MSNKTHFNDQPAWQRTLAKALLMVVIVSLIFFIFIQINEPGIKDIEICASIILFFAYKIIRSES